MIYVLKDIFTILFVFGVFLFIHELGHLLVLKYFYHEKQTGIAIGNILYSKRARILFKNRFLEFRIYNLVRLKGIVGFVYPWNGPYNDTNNLRVFLFAASGTIFELIFLSILYFSTFVLKNFILIVSIKYIVLLLLFALLFSVYYKSKLNIGPEVNKLLKTPNGIAYSDSILMARIPVLLNTLRLIIFLFLLMVSYDLSLFLL